MYSKLKVLILGLLIIMSFDPLLAASETSGIPWNLIQAQVFNFAIFIILLVFVVRKPGAAHFAKFREDFLEESTKAQRIVAAAEKQKKEIEDQLMKLETTYSSKLETAKKEAQMLKESIIKDTKDRADKLILDTKESASILFKSAEQVIRNQVLEIAVNTAKNDLAKKIDTKESQRLHGEFLEEISAGSL